jgi:hypothetical protein
MFGAGFAVGIGVGFATGLLTGRLVVEQKSWSELDDGEKRTRKIAIGAISFLVILGIVALVWALLSM